MPRPPKSDRRRPAVLRVPPIARGLPRAPQIPGGFSIGPLRPGERKAVLDLCWSTGFFYPEEIEVCAELIDVYIKRSRQKDYIHEVVREGDAPVGWVCYGPTPMTAGAWDLYWVATRSDRQRLGIGEALMRRAEQVIKAKGGYLIVVETSGREHYAPTRAFYEAIGYPIVARIPDYYAPGDAICYHVRRL